MWNTSSQLHERLTLDLAEIAVIDTHEHAHIGFSGPDYTILDPIVFLLRHYLDLDILSSDSLPAKEYKLLFNETESIESRWPSFKKAWDVVACTAYARVATYVLEDICGVTTPSIDVLYQLRDYLGQRNTSKSISNLKDCGIQKTIADVFFPPNSQRPLRYFENKPLADFLESQKGRDEFFKPAFNLQYFHELRHYEFIHFVEELSDCSIHSLHEYENAVFILLQKSIKNGVICIKDQSAYRRTLAYDVTPYYEAELLFTKILSDPRNQLAWPEAKPLDDYLFHSFMKFAEQLKLPVQIHTGHVANIRNRVEKANAEKLSTVLELHKRVRFDLFHGNWPYMGDLLFLCKNYPNVHINLCWTHMIDPDYTVELIKRAIKVLPSNKLHAFGGDFWDAPEFTCAHLRLAKENFTHALSEVISSNWLSYEDALQYAKHSFYDNPNQFYDLSE